MMSNAKGLAWWTTGMLTVVMLATVAAMAHPKPSPVPRSWDLTFSHEMPRPIAVTDAQGRTHWYWYMLYRVENHSGQERFFSPEIVVATDKGDIVTAGDNVPLRVFRAIEARVNDPLLENPVGLVGRILMGEDHGRNTVAIWPAFGHDVDFVSVFIGGLSGETVTVIDPVTEEPVLLRKTVMVDFAFPGTEVHPQRQSIEKIGQRWIMR